MSMMAPRMVASRGCAGMREISERSSLIALRGNRPSWARFEYPMAFGRVRGKPQGRLDVGSGAEDDEVGPWLDCCVPQVRQTLKDARLV